MIRFLRPALETNDVTVVNDLTRDGVHFSEKGSRLAADAMLKAWNMK